MKVKDVLGKDKKLLKLINALGEEPISRINSDGKVCEHLVNAIISQQLSVKVARVIAERFWAMIGTKAKMVDKILAQEHSDLRACGLSNQKQITSLILQIFGRKIILKINHFNQ